jgi:hypothetical protein
MHQVIESSTFLDFKGWFSFRNINVSENMFTGIILEKQNNFNITENFFSICNKYIEDRTYKVNKLLLNKIQLSIISKGYDYTTDMIIKLFENKFGEFYKQMLDSIENNIFSISYFSKEYYKLNNKLNNIKFLLSSIDYSYKNKHGKKSDYSFINLVKNYVSYNMIINTKYKKGKQEYFLCELFINEIEENYNTESILQFFKIYDFYNKFSYIARNKKNKNGIEYFDPDLNKKIIFSEDTVNKFITRVIEIIDKKIIDLTKNSNISIEQNEKDIKYVRNLITVCPELCNKNVFLVLYKKAFTQRLKKNSNPDIENEFLKSLDPQIDIELYIKMKNQINDIKLNKQHNDIYKKIIIGTCSDKYKNTDVNKFNRDIVNIKVCRSYDWDYEYKSDYKIYNLPISLLLYLDIFNAYHKDRFNERSLIWLYDECIGIVEFTTDKTYNIRMNLLQLAVFYSLNESSKTATELSTILNIDLHNLGIILNSLLMSKLINRSNGSSNNTNVIFIVNEQFSSNDSYNSNENNFSIVSIYDKVIKMSENKDRQIEDTSNFPSETVLRAKIMANVISEKIINKDKLIDNINNYFKINMPMKYVDKVISDIAESNDRIKINQNTIVFINNDSNDSNDNDDDLNDIEEVN